MNILGTFGFQIGDCVRIRQFEDMAAEYEVDCDGDISIPDIAGYFYHDMKHHCGLEFVISGCDRHYVFGHCCKDKDGYDEDISVHMIEPTEPDKPYDQEEINSFLKQFEK